jgi:hypothetical protein
MSRASIELNFLARRDKQTTLPALVFTRHSNLAQGLYYEPEQDAEVIIDGRAISLSCGLISIDDSMLVDSIEATLAHEWRHHWQATHGWDLRVTLDFDFTNEETYWREVRRYYRRQPWEYDALLFEISVAPTDFNLLVFDVARTDSRSLLV